MRNLPSSNVDNRKRLVQISGDLNFTPNDARLPHYPKQKIWPYTDLVSHRLYMKNDVRKGWIRTPPLWGKGLMKVCTGHDDRLYDARARNVIEAIMWHGCSREARCVSRTLDH